MEFQNWIEIQALPGNNACADCKSNNPEWASVSYGVLVCISCSGHHRSLGTHISFVRSIKLDCWSTMQLKSMKFGGNDALNNYLQDGGLKRSLSIREKYDNDVARLYRLKIVARVNGEIVPEKLPPPQFQNHVKKIRKYEGIGSTPVASRVTFLERSVKWVLPSLIIVGALIMSRR